MQQYSMTEGCSQGTLDFLHQLVQRNLESVLAANQSESTPEKKQMSEDAQALVVSCVERVRKLAWKYAGGSYDLVEELISIGMLGLCEAAASLPVGYANPVGYLYKAAEHDMINELRRLYTCSIVSLDAPLSDEGSFCLADVLSDRSSLPVAAPSNKRVRALNAAMRRLVSARQRAAVRRRAGLPGYGVHSLEEIGRALHASSNAAHCLDQRGRRKLRADVQLCKVMGVEVVCDV